ncbi:AI-2E family transporter [Tumidithrix elongata RA019]|uniref:AI-2E family transporter n=1 Tax=Tumidithrix elongata BACA0141 TaxID=2716417 RepID=A0AAW9Q591_9CYAN|nr:AI-2E family transporter [Tumidithrix elongata RA019]
MATDNPLLKRLNFWLIFPLIILNGWLVLKTFQFFQPIASILITAAILAFLLNFAVQLLVSRGAKRSNAVILVFLLALSIFIGVGITVVPIAIGQLSELVKRLPSWLDSGAFQLTALQAWADSQNIRVDLSGIAIQITDRLSGQLQTFAGKTLGIALDTVGSAVNVLLTLVLAFYFLSNGDRIWQGIFQWLPTHLGTQVQTSLRQNFQNYYVGQATVGTLNGICLTLAFLLLDVPFGILFGFGVGLTSLIPFGGAFTIGLVTLLLVLDNFWLGIKFLITAVAVDQIISNLVAPRILGNLTGLNPAWILVSLLLGLQLGGPLGLVIAVPIASAIKGVTDSLRAEQSAEKALQGSSPAPEQVAPH